MTSRSKVEDPAADGGRRRADRRLVLALYLLALVPPLLMLASIARHAVNVPVWDEWEFPLLLTQLEAGELSVTELAWLQRGEHRKIFPHLTILALAHLTQYNVLAHIYLAAALRVIALGLLWRLLAATVAPAATRTTAVLTLLSSLLLFSAAEYENWIWGESAIMVSLLNLAIVTLAWALHRWPAAWTGLSAALAAATVAAFSAASGLLLWGVGTVGLTIYCRLAGRRWLDRLVVAWLSCAAVLTTLYFSGWAPRLQTEIDLEPRIETLRHHLAYSLSYLGAQLQLREGVGWMVAAGSVGLLAFLLAAGNMIRRRAGGVADRVPWLLLALFVGAAALLTSIGRSGFGLDQPSRYVGISSLFWIATLALAAIAWRRAGARSLPLTVAGAAVALLLAAGYAFSYGKGYEKLEARGRFLRDKRVYLRHVESARHQLRGLYPKLEMVFPRVDALRSLGMGVFADRTRREHLRIYAEPEIPAEVALPVAPGVVVTQTFVSRCGRLASIFLRLDGDGGSLRARLIEQASGDVAHDGPVGDGATGPYRRIGIAPAEKAAAPTRYGLEIRRAGDATGPAPKLWRSSAEARPDAELTLDGRPLGADLSFRYGCAPLRPGEEHPLDLAPGFAEAKVAWHRGVVGGVGREVLFMVPPGAAASWVVAFPATGRAVFSSGLLLTSVPPGGGDADASWSEDPPPSDGARFRLSVDAGDQRPIELLAVHVDPWSNERDRRFVPVTVDLADWAGQTILLRLETDPGPSGQSDWDLSGWVEPRLSVGAG